jgi:hypothetical protein
MPRPIKATTRQANPTILVEKMPRRRRINRTDLAGQRNTVVVQAYRDSPFDELYPHMLIEDVGLRIMPLGRRWTDRDFAVVLEPASGSLEELLSQALKPEGREGLTDALCEFVRETAQLVMHYGRAICELVYYRDENDVVAAIEFGYVPPDSITIEGAKYLQRVPAELAAQYEIATEIRGPASDLMIFDSPIQAPALHRMLMSLAEVGRPVLPDFVQKQILGEENIGYSSTDEILFTNLGLAEASRDVGWDMRSMFSKDDYFLEYYAIVRRLRFERFLIQFRDRLIDQLNSYLVGIGEIVGETGRLTVTGLPTDADVNAAEASLEHGDKDFKDLLEPFSIR